MVKSLSELKNDLEVGIVPFRAMQSALDAVETLIQFEARRDEAVRASEAATKKLDALNEQIGAKNAELETVQDTIRTKLDAADLDASAITRRAHDEAAGIVAKAQSDKGKADAALEEIIEKVEAAATEHAQVLESTKVANAELERINGLVEAQRAAMSEALSNLNK